MNFIASSGPMATTECNQSQQASLNNTKDLKVRGKHEKHPEQKCPQMNEMNNSLSAVTLSRNIAIFIKKKEH